MCYEVHHERHGGTEKYLARQTSFAHSVSRSLADHKIIHCTHQHEFGRSVLLYSLRVSVVNPSFCEATGLSVFHHSPNTSSNACRITLASGLMVFPVVASVQYSTPMIPWFTSIPSPSMT